VPAGYNAKIDKRKIGSRPAGSTSIIAVSRAPTLAKIGPRASAAKNRLPIVGVMQILATSARAGPAAYSPSVNLATKPTTAKSRALITNMLSNADMTQWGKKDLGIKHGLLSQSASQNHGIMSGKPSNRKPSSWRTATRVHHSKPELTPS
jgi:hypothetical protein